MNIYTVETQLKQLVNDPTCRLTPTWPVRISVSVLCCLMVAFGEERLLWDTDYSVAISFVSADGDGGRGLFRLCN